MEIAVSVNHETKRASELEVDCVFHQPWWLEALAPGQWDEVTVKRNGGTVARLPYVRKKRFGFTILGMAPCSYRLGPWLRPPDGKSSHRVAEEERLLQVLIEQLPPFDLFQQNFMPEVCNWLPFYWAGFEQTTNYTYRLEDLTDLEAVWAGFHHNARNEIRKAEKKVAVRTDLGIERFIELHGKTYQRQGVDSYSNPELIRRLDAACIQNHCRQMFFAEDAGGNTHAALYVVWGQRLVYSVLAGSDPEMRNSGAGSLLFWRAIQLASEQAKGFDFAGSMIRRVERHFRNYGARQVPYFHVWKMSRRMKALNCGRQLWHAVLGK